MFPALMVWGHNYSCWSGNWASPSAAELQQSSAVWGTGGVGSKPAYWQGARDERDRDGAGLGAEVFHSRLFFPFMFGCETNSSVEDQGLSVLLFR